MAAHGLISPRQSLLRLNVVENVVEFVTARLLGLVGHFQQLGGATVELLHLLQTLVIEQIGI